MSLFLPFLISSLSHAQKATYISKIDEDLTIKNILVMPSIDNIDGIYARPVDSYLQERINGKHRFQLIEKSIAGSILSPIELERSPEEVIRVAQSASADAILAASISKGRSGLNLRLSLLSGKDGKLLSFEQDIGLTKYEINEIRAQLGIMLEKVIAKLPFQARILSRQGNRVTLDMGSLDGLKPDQILSVVQIIQIERHPKFNFIVGADKEVLGKVKVLKVDETISFGIILSEKERELIQVNAKVSSLDLVNYADTNPYLPAEAKLAAQENTGSKITFGETPKAWVPVRPPTFGAAQLKLALGTYSTSSDDGTDNESANKNIYPTIGLYGELWLTPKWTVELELNQGVLNVNNPGSSGPSNLNISTTEYNFNLSYGLLMEGNFFGPKLQGILGINSYKRFVDSGSAFRSTRYSGISLGVRGSSPVGRNRDIRFGFEFFVQLSGSLNESPSSTGSSASNSVNRYGFFLEKKYLQNIWFVGALDFKSYATNFSTGSSSQRINSLSGGLKYLF